MIRYLTRFVFLLSVLLLLSHATAAIPGADDPNAYTRWTMQRDLLEFNRRTTVEAYKQFGHRDPKWDDHAIAMLTGFATRMTEGRLPEGYRTGLPKIDEVAAHVQPIIDAGCNDPLVLDFCAIARLETRQTLKARDLAQKSFDAFEAAGVPSKYPIFRQMNNARRLRALKASTEKPEALVKLDQRFFDLAVRSITSNESRGLDRRVIFYMLDDDVRVNWPIERSKQFIDQISADKNSDPWLVKTFAGRYYVRAGWAARGTGYAGTVDEKGWAGLKENLAKARENLVDAWKLEPKYPEAPTLMIGVTMGGGGLPGVSQRQWFERAAAAQFDFDEAYDQFTYAMTPRWGGSYQDMIEFGLECAATDRYETDVPFKLIKAMNTVRDDGPIGWEIWRTPELFDRAAQVLEGYSTVKVPTGKSIKAWSDTALAGYGWQAGRLDVARKALDTTQGKLDSGALEHAQINFPKRMVSGLYSLTGGHTKELLAAEQLAKQEQYAQAAAAYSQVAPDDRERTWITGRTRELQMLADFAKGEWIDLVPQDDTLAGFEILGGTWSVQTVDGKRVLIGTANDGGLILLCAARFGPHYELRATVEIIDAAGSRDPGAGMMYGYSTSSRFNACWMFPKSQTERVKYDPDQDMTPPMKGKVIDGENRFFIQVWNEHGKIIVNDKDPTTFKYMRDWAQRPEAVIGFGATARNNGTRVRFKDVAIRRLTEDFEKE